MVAQAASPPCFSGWGRLGALAHLFLLDSSLAAAEGLDQGGDGASEWTRLQGPVPGLGCRGELTDIWRLVLRGFWRRC